MGMAATNYLSEAERLLETINESRIGKKDDWIFFQSMKARVQARGHVTQKQIFWLRDIKDRQLSQD